MTHFGKHLKEDRTSTGLTQKELGEKVSIDHSYISKMEKEEYLPSREVAEGLADALGMPNKPVTLHVSPQEKDALKRFIFLLEANVAGTEDVLLVELGDDQAMKSKQQAISTPTLTTGHSAIAPPLRRRRNGALASPPIEEPTPVPDLVDSTTVGQDIDKELEDLSQEERDSLREFLVSHARQSVRLVRLNRRG